MPRCSGTKGTPWDEEHDPDEKQWKLNAVNYRNDDDNEEWCPNRVGQVYILHYRTGERMTAVDENGKEFALKWGVKSHLELLQGCILNCMCVSTKDPYKYVFTSSREMRREMKRWDANTTFYDDE